MEEYVAPFLFFLARFYVFRTTVWVDSQWCSGAASLAGLGKALWHSVCSFPHCSSALHRGSSLKPVTQELYLCGCLEWLQLERVKDASRRREMELKKEEIWNTSLLRQQTFSLNNSLLQIQPPSRSMSSQSLLSSPILWLPKTGEILHRTHIRNLRWWPNSDKSDFLWKAASHNSSQIFT